MADRLMHKNLQSNPHASYLFMESKERYVGKRLYLKSLRRKRTESSLIRSVEGRAARFTTVYQNEIKYLVYFRVDKVLPLIGDKK